MYYVYVLQSERDGGLYIGFTSDLRKRFAQHQAGTETATKARTPWRLVYYEACTNKTNALHREHYLKTSWGRRYLKHRLKNALKGPI